MQEAFLQLHKKLAEFRGDARFSTWFYRIVTNAALMNRRSARRRRTESIDVFLPVFDEEGTHVPVTVIEAGPCPIVQVTATHVQLGFGAKKAKRSAAGLAGHAKKAGLDIDDAALHELQIDPIVPILPWIPWHVWFPWRPLWCWWWHRRYYWYRCCPWW